jgi:hypothetical protein
VHGEEFHNLYSSPNVITNHMEEAKMIGAYSTHGKEGEIHTRM